MTYFITKEQHYKIMREYAALRPQAAVVNVTTNADSLQRNMAVQDRIRAEMNRMLTQDVRRAP